MEIVRHEVSSRFCEATVVDFGTAKLVTLAGQVAENTSLDITGQTRDVLRHVDRLLRDAGSDKTKILSATIYLADVGDFAAMNSVWDEWVPEGKPPARATLGARLIRSDYKIEMLITAVA